MKSERDVVIVAGARTPFIKAGTELARVSAVDLGRIAMREAIERAEIDPDWIDEVVVGNIAGPPDAANIARVIALSAKVPQHVPAFTVNRNCASGLEAVVEAAYRIRAGDADLIVVGAAESMSQIPLLFSPEAQVIWTKLARSKGALAKLATLARFRPRHFNPVIGLMLGLTDPVSGLNMGQTAEVLAREFGIGREEQDRFALLSHQRTAAAWVQGRMDREVVPVPLPPKFDKASLKDNGIRENQTMEALGKLRPVFDRRYGTVTAGNSSQITDGAAALVLASARRAKELGLNELGRLRSWGFAGCDPARMGLGPVLATPIALRRAGNVPIDRIDLVEINEAF
ncbi:MAG: thiolase family protein, partial [Acidobacteriota bacterium]